MKELQIGGKEMQFKRECIPWNKGMKGIHLSRSSEFKKGNQPQNTKYDFCISVRKDKNKKDYKFIRMSKGNWIPLSHFIWESVHEKIPKGYMIIFKDKNQMNFNSLCIHVNT